VLPTGSLIRKIKIGEKVRTSIEVLDNIARVTIESDITCRYDFEFSDWEKKPLFGCWFYFGGNRKAPHDITIRYNETDENICSLLHF
jgi:hypothetical protein